MEHSSGAAFAAAFGISLLIVSLGLAISLLFCFCVRQRNETTVQFTPLKENLPSSIELSSTAQALQFSEIKTATKDFSRKLGEGGFGPVYHGQLSDGTEIAVKVQASDSSQGSTEFTNEVLLLSRAHHRNVVSLRGYCETPQILVYEYLSGGTLEQYLDAEASTPLPWKTRLAIALDAARGLEYLHNGCSPPIIHRDVKSGNILLTDKMEAKVADFGLSRLVSSGLSRIITNVKGTLGYVDPEYCSSLELTQKSDVYSFGIVLLELISGRDAYAEEQRKTKLSAWARAYMLEHRLTKIMDPGLKQDYKLESAWKVAELAMFCVEPRSVHRPTMCEVVQELKQAVGMEDGTIPLPVARVLPPQLIGKNRHAHSDPCYRENQRTLI